MVYVGKKKGEKITPVTTIPPFWSFRYNAMSCVPMRSANQCCSFDAYHSPPRLFPLLVGLTVYKRVPANDPFPFFVNEQSLSGAVMYLRCNIPLAMQCEPLDCKNAK